MAIIISDTIRAKLQAKHDVSPKEVEECFLNRDGGIFMDTREEHRTDPPTLWFVAETNRGRKLKVCYVQDGRLIKLKTAYQANDAAISLYERLNSGR